MALRHVGSASAAALLTCALAAFAQTRDQTPTDTSASARSSSETPITLYGCVVRERDFRRDNQFGRGGPASTGAGLGNEYVLVNASVASEGAGNVAAESGEPAASAATPSSASASDCGTFDTADAYELTGSRERDLERFVGQRVQITGMLKSADLRSDSAAPSGGFDPLRQDLRLHEVNVTSFQAAPAGAAAQRAERAEPQPAAPGVAEPQPVGTTGAQEEALPATASPLPLAGLIGLLSMGGALGIRALRRR